LFAFCFVRLQMKLVMKTKERSKLNLWLEKKLYFPGLSDKQLQGNINVFANHIFLSFITLTQFIVLSIFVPQATLFIHYMIAFSSLYALSLLLQLLFPKPYMVIHTCISTTMYLLTFYYIYRMGGIATSAGCIFAGISNVLATIPRQRTWFPISMFSLFFILILIVTILKPWLHVPAQMTPGLNSLLYAYNALILTGGALGFVLQFIRQQRKLEEMETEHLKEINEFKDRFFTNITHEFRTPLTIIKGMGNLIKARPQEWMGTGLQKIETNSDILLRLVNQMLSLAKAEAGAISVNLTRRDVKKYLAYLVEQFSSEAHRRRIDLRFTSAGEPFEMDFDPEKLMHIITNLVSNALKYTPEGGRVEITIGVEDNGKMFSIKVKDTGIGIEKEHLDHLFDRFYRVEHQLSPGGTGIGLALTREMVQLLQGTISVESIKGEGSEFTVFLPVTRNAPLSDIPEPAGLINVTDDDYRSTSSYGEPFYPRHSPEGLLSVVSDSSAKLPLLLIVEDSSDVVLYLQAILKYEYRIEIAENGRTGMKKALEIMPDIILSDIMMPVMDGIEMLEKVKNDIRTSHIPVVMLTAKADIDSRLAGLERGADAYLAKPVDERELHIQMKNLVELRKRLYERYRSLEKYPQTLDINIKKEDEFMIKVRQALETNLKDDEFGVSQLCSELSVSRAQLYRKFKFVCNRTVADYLKSLRLYKAKELFLTTNLNVTEVTYLVGFKNLSHFSREFTNEFGKPPSEFRK
jgi:signal transduction histidine kinase/DNA-binding response OmpR family regulator